uniref:Cytochrome c oxidase subunit 2 n=1 Tax=Thyreus decorus TaxID=600203 RepID=A0A7U0M7T1_9HYME|nr:cytochrome c oxidase subunit II [Thyreus decorus]QQX27975.1 cytochrome c oxidase subunit 2 [Thyreus decorus]
MATWNNSFFQNSNSIYLDHLISFHNMTFMFMLIIISVTIYTLLDLFYNSYMNLYTLKNHMLEMIWTVLPMIVLLMICSPSLKILYFMDESMYQSCFTVKAIGHQWYWSYEYPDFDNIEFDAYFDDVDENNNFRNLEVDNRVVVPYGTLHRVLASSSDVIHSWSIPCLGIKIDAIPGRLNQTIMCLFRPGLFFGQCSEICGLNHSYMPIVLESTSFEMFTQWAEQHQNNS